MKRKTFLLFLLAICTAGLNAQETFTLTVGDIHVTHGNRATLNITSDVALGSYGSFEFKLLLPSGVKLPYNYDDEEEAWSYGYYDDDEEEWVNPVSINNTKKAHVLSYSNTETGCSFLCTTPSSNTTYFNSTKPLSMEILLEADAEAINDIYAITLTDVVFAEVSTNKQPDKITIVSGTCIVSGATNKEKTIVYNMTPAGWGTLILPFAADVPAGLTAYSCNEVTGETLKLVSADALAANTPYILAGTAGVYEFKGIPAVTEKTYAEGLLVGTHISVPVSTGYVLQKNDDLTAFYQVDADAPINVPANRCYLNYTAPSSSPILRIGGTTGIKYPLLQEGQGTVSLYDLTGRRVQILEQGIYIMDGKKVIIK